MRKTDRDLAKQHLVQAVNNMAWAAYHVRCVEGYDIELSDKVREGMENLYVGVGIMIDLLEGIHNEISPRVEDREAEMLFRQACAYLPVAYAGGCDVKDRIKHHGKEV